MSKKVLVPMADGFEEIEAMCIIDVLRRSGASVTVASVKDLQVTAAHDVKIIADTLISDCIDNIYDLIALPGGMPGAERLRDSKELIHLLKAQVHEGRLYAAVCASPAVVFQYHGLIDMKKVTCYPSFVDQLANNESADSDVIVDGNCITSQGPGTALRFSLKLVEVLYGKHKADELSSDMVVS